MDVNQTFREQYAAERAAEWLSDKRLLKFVRRQVNTDLRKWRQAVRDGNPDATDLVVDCKARIKLLDWVDRWSKVREPDYDCRDRSVLAQMHAYFELIVASVRYLAQAYEGREGWRKEWKKL